MIGWERPKRRKGYPSARLDSARLPAADPLCGLWLACLLLVGCAAGPFSANNPAGPEPTSPYLLVSGDRLIYHGRTVTIRGENFNNEPAMACCGVPDTSRINTSAADYAQMSTVLGGNLVRFGLEYQWYKKDAATFYQVLDQHIQLAKANHLWLIPVMYDPPGGSSGGYSGQEGFWGSKTNQQMLTDFWVDFARHYADESTMAGFDIFNEPAPPTADAWRAWAQDTTDAVAKVDSNHFVVIEVDSADYNVPAVHGPRILWSGHCYAKVGTDGCNFPGPNPRSPINRPFLIGEVGAKTKTDDTAYVPGGLDAFNRNGISWIHFVMREPDDGFGLYASSQAGDFSRPRAAMIDTVKGAMAGSVKPD